MEANVDYYEIRSSLVPRCTPRSPSETLRRHEPITFEPDIVKMRRILKGYRTRIVAGEPEEGREDLLEEFVRKRRDWVEYASEHAEFCRRWDPPLASVEVLEREEGRKR
ncbi:hypothetical protein FRC01_013295 [Tulasnella sp. 417]|nr:hypothetical protein FRC01_013295 [Tulasnella sp. 417]